MASLPPLFCLFRVPKAVARQSQGGFVYFLAVPDVSKAGFLSFALRSGPPNPASVLTMERPVIGGGHGRRAAVTWALILYRLLWLAESPILGHVEWCQRA